MRKKMFALVMLMTMTLQVLVAAEPMLKLTIKDSKSDPPADVKMNLPIGMLEAMRPTIQEALDNIDIDGQEIDLKALWKEMKKAGPNDFVDVKGKDGNVKVSTTKTHIVIKADSDGQNMNILLPFELADAFLGGQKIDADGLIETVKKFKGKELLSVIGDTVEIKLWVE